MSRFFRWNRWLAVFGILAIADTGKATPDRPDGKMFQKKGKQACMTLKFVSESDTSATVTLFYRQQQVAYADTVRVHSGVNYLPVPFRFMRTGFGHLLIQEGRNAQMIHLFYWRATGYISCW